MTETKTWYQSRTIWGALVAILAAFLQLAGFEFGAEQSVELVDAAMTIGGAIGGLVALWGRLGARSAIAPGGSRGGGSSRLHTGK